MAGQGRDRSPEAPQSAAPGGEGYDAYAASGPGTAVAVLHRDVVVHPGDVDVVVPAGLVADLHGPSIVISPSYVGPDRRRHARGGPDHTSAAPGIPLWVRRIGLVCFLTAVVVAPLTMIAVRSTPPAATGSVTGPAPSAQAPTSPRARAEAARHPGHVFTASPEQIARAEAAYQRALARVEPTVGAAAVVAPTAGATTGSTAGGGAPVSAGASQAAAARAADQTRNQQARVEAQSVAAQQRASRQAARAQARADRTARHRSASTP